MAKGVGAEGATVASGERQESYGSPLDGFNKVVGMARILFDGRGPETAEEHGMYMILLKLSREVHKHKHDNLVDIVGYVETIKMCIEEREQRAKSSV